MNQTPKRPKLDDPDVIIKKRDQEIDKLRNENRKLRLEVKRLKEAALIYQAMNPSDALPVGPLTPVMAAATSSAVLSPTSFLAHDFGQLSAHSSCNLDPVSDCDEAIRTLSDEHKRQEEVLRKELEVNHVEIYGLHTEIGEYQRRVGALERELVSNCKKMEKSDKDMFYLRRLKDQYRVGRNYLQQRVKDLVDGKKEERSRQEFSTLKSYNSKQKRLALAMISFTDIAGEEDFSEFLESFIKYATKHEKLKFRSKLSAEESVFICSRLGITKTLTSKMKAFFLETTGHDPFASRNEMDEVEKEQVDPDTIETWTHADGTVVGQLNNIKATLEKKLASLSSSNKLVFDEITKEDIHFGIFGDKGGDHTKVVGVIVNVRDSNSRVNIIPLGMYKGDDKPECLEKYMVDVFEQLNNLETVEYEENGQIVERNVEQLLGGDCKFLAACLGHKGAQCADCCWFCNLHNDTSYKIKNTGVGFKDERTIAQYMKDSLEGTKSVTKGSKVLLTRIKMCNIIPPSLHIIMGIAQRYLFDFLLQKAAGADLTSDFDLNAIKVSNKRLREIKKLKSALQHNLETGRKDIGSMNNMIVALNNFAARKIDKLRNAPKRCPALCCVFQDKVMKKSDLTKFECASCSRHFHGMCSGLWVDADRTIYGNPDEFHQCFECEGIDNVADVKSQLQKMIEKMENYLVELESEDAALNQEKADIDDVIVNKSGPHRKALEQCWKKFGGDISAWRQTFTGNQIYSLLSEESIDAMFALFPVNSTTIHLKVAAKHLSVIQKMCVAKRFTDFEMAQFRNAVDDFVQSMKLAHPNDSVTLKFHLLDAHVIPYVEKFRSWAYPSEQGVEACHSYVSKLFEMYNSIKNKEMQMEKVFHRFLLNNTLADEFEFFNR